MDMSPGPTQVESILAERAIRSLDGIVSAQLKRVLYFHSEGEISREDLREQPHVLRGEIQLLFDGRPSIFITWDEHAGCIDEFSLQVRTTSASVPDSLLMLDASDCPLWKIHLGAVLESVDILGIRETPHVLGLHFPTGTIFVGNGDGENKPPLRLFGNMDHVIVLSEEEAARRGELLGFALLWQSHPPLGA